MTTSSDQPTRLKLGKLIGSPPILSFLGLSFSWFFPAIIHSNDDFRLLLRRKKMSSLHAREFTSTYLEIDASMGSAIKHEKTRYSTCQR